LKIKELIGRFYQSAGLNLINVIARSGDYERLSDIPFGSARRNYLDHYRIDGDSARPTVLFFYGGNWRSGNKSDYRFVADTLACQGFNVVVPDYRLYPSVRFPEILQDAQLAYQWTLENVPENQPLFIMGHSAGAQLGSLLTLNQSLLSQSYNCDQRLSGFVGLAGPYDFYPFTEDDHWDLFSPKERYAESQAVNFIRHDAPPLYLLHGKEDTRVRRGHSKSLMEKVVTAGGQADREIYEAMGHVDIILEFTRLHRRGSKVVEDISRFMKQKSI